MKINCPVIQPVQLNQSPLSWTGSTRLGDDPCYIATKTCDSQQPGQWSLSGYDPKEETSCDHQKRLSTLMTFQKPYLPGGKYIDCDSQLIHPRLTNLRTLHPLFTRPYVGNYQGPGMGSLSPESKVIESQLQQGNLDAVYHGKIAAVDITDYAFNYLPPYGNPQSVDHVVQPPPSEGGWVRGGVSTRDLTKEVDYRRRVFNEENSQLLRDRI